VPTSARRAKSSALPGRRGDSAGSLRCNPAVTRAPGSGAPTILSFGHRRRPAASTTQSRTKATYLTLQFDLPAASMAQNGTDHTKSDARKIAASCGRIGSLSGNSQNWPASSGPTAAIGVLL
jgi:hypothetical protein